jgi:hypothetical protein
MLELGGMWPWKRKPDRDGFPKGFRAQRIVSSAANAISGLPAPEIAMYFRDHLGTATQLLTECRDKRYTPSTYIVERADGFEVGWITRAVKHECAMKFSNFADAATDYLLFSLGKGRWRPPSD